MAERASYNFDNPCGDVDKAEAALKKLGVKNATVSRGVDATKVKVEGDNIDTARVARALNDLYDSEAELTGTAAVDNPRSASTITGQQVPAEGSQAPPTQRTPSRQPTVAPNVPVEQPAVPLPAPSSGLRPGTAAPTPKPSSTTVGNTPSHGERK